LDTVLGLAVVFATLAGPILAVLITRLIDRNKQKREQQLNVFRSIMGTRRAPLSAERVKALNMVEIEFYGIKSVQDAYRDVMTHINIKPLPAGWSDDHRKQLTKLLSEMAKTLGYELQQLDLLDGGYYPQGLTDLEDEQRAVRQSMIEVLSGRRPLIVSPAAPTPPSPFPPPPTPTPTPTPTPKR